MLINGKFKHLAHFDLILLNFQIIIWLCYFIFNEIGVVDSDTFNEEEKLYSIFSSDAPIRGTNPKPKIAEKKEVRVRNDQGKKKEEERKSHQKESDKKRLPDRERQSFLNRRGEVTSKDRYLTYFDIVIQVEPSDKPEIALSNQAMTLLEQIRSQDPEARLHPYGNDEGKVFGPDDDPSVPKAGMQLKRYLDMKGTIGKSGQKSMDMCGWVLTRNLENY